jgi:hypothetical protein
LLAPKRHSKNKRRGEFGSKVWVIDMVTIFKSKILLRVLFTMALVPALSFAQEGDFKKADTSRVSIGTFTGATEAGAASVNAQISRNGRFVVFESTATNLINYTPVSPNRRHVYLLDRQAGSLELVSINRFGTEAAGENYSPSISADGRYVAFVSTANGDQFFGISFCDDVAHVNVFYPGTHIYVRDRLANKTFLASQVTTPMQVQAGVCEGTGAQVKKVCRIPDCDLNNPANYTLEPVMADVTKRVSAGIRPYVTYVNQTRVLQSPTSLNPKISGDGQFVAFDSDADNLGGFAPPYTYYKAVADETDAVNCANGSCDYTNSSLSASGGVIRAKGGDVVGFNPFRYYFDTNGATRDILVRDGKALTTQIVNFACQFHAAGGCNVQGQRDSVKPQISDDGGFVSFQSTWNYLDLDFNGVNDIFLVARSKINGEVSSLDRISNNTSRLLAANAESVNSSMSSDGRYIAFDSAATNIITGDTNNARDVFVYDSKFFVTVRCGTVSAPQGNGASSNPSIDGSGNYISFQSAATNWGPTTGIANIFVGKLIRDSIGRLSACQVELATVGSGTGGNDASSISTLGTVPRTSATPGAPRLQIPAVAYQSLSTNLHTGATDNNGLSDIFQAPGCSATDLVTDTDGDGTIDCFDQCKDDPVRVTDTDSDTDGYPDCEDGCDNDPQKVGPGVCGCGVLDTDSDSDGTPDCTDNCPNDPAKVAVGTCGCGVADADINQNSIIDCVESQAPTSPTPSTTPGTEPTAVPTAAASPTPDPSLSTKSPGTAALTRVNARSARIVLSPVLDLGAALAGYEVGLERIVGSRVNEAVTFTQNTTILTRKLSRGKYRARFRIINSAGVRSLWSAYSKTFTVR